MVMHRRLPEVEFPGVHGGSIDNLWPEQLKTLPEAQKGPRLLSLKLELLLQLKRIPTRCYPTNFNVSGGAVGLLQS